MILPTTKMYAGAGHIVMLHQRQTSTQCSHQNNSFLRVVNSQLIDFIEWHILCFVLDQHYGINGQITAVAIFHNGWLGFRLVAVIAYKCLVRELSTCRTVGGSQRKGYTAG